MRKNLPVTHVETQLPENEFIYSRTDLKGVITEVNEAFCKVSGFTRDEMVGQSHNMVRHPDMPIAAFQDLWDDLKAGRPWRGVVKNRRKDGGFYWVVANVTPVRENGRVMGYQSVRSRPDRREIEAAAEAYRRINDGNTRLAVDHGRVARIRSSWVKASTSLGTQMAFVSVLLILLAAIDLVEVVFKLDFGVAHELLMAFSALYAVYSLSFFIPRVTRDLESVSAWIDGVLTTGNLKSRLDVDRSDLLGVVVKQMDSFVASVQATVQGMADTAKQVDSVTHDVDGGMRVVHQSAIKQSEACLLYTSRCV